MKKRSILTVLMALFLVLLISCADSNTGGGSDNDDTGDNGGGGGSGTGGLNYTPELEEDNTNYNLGYYVYGDGKQKEFFNKCVGEAATGGMFGVECNSVDTLLPYLNPIELEPAVDQTQKIIYTINNTNENMYICFSYSPSGSSAETCKTETTVIPIDSSPSVYIGLNSTKLEELKTNNTPELTGSFTISNNINSETKTATYKVKLIGAVTAECLSGATVDDYFPNVFTCNAPDESNGKFILNDTNSLASFSIGDMLVNGSKSNTFTNLKVKFEEGFSDVFTIDQRSTCSIKNSVVSIDKNCDLFINKKQGLTGKKTLTMTGTINLYEQTNPPTPLPAVPLNATYTFIAE